MLEISETFFSVQGEGNNIGTPAVFLRLSKCNLQCCYCDSKYSLAEGEKRTVGSLLQEIINFKNPYKFVVITGGEPLLQQNRLPPLLYDLKKLGYKIEVETNGTISPSFELLQLVDSWVVSPKLSNSGHVSRFEEGVFPYGTTIIKFVIDKPEDLKELDNYVMEKEIINQIYLMPQAITAKEHNSKLPWIIEHAKLHGYKVSPRLQILVWGNKRGV